MCSMRLFCASAIHCNKADVKPAVRTVRHEPNGARNLGLLLPSAISATRKMETCVVKLQVLLLLLLFFLTHRVPVQSASVGCAGLRS